MTETAHGGARHSVLYVDDNPTNVKLVEAVLAARPDIEVLSAPDARAGVEAALAHQPDLVLLDLRLPDAAGEEVLAWLAGDPATASIPAVVLTAEDDPETARRLLAAGARAFVTKPFDIQRLLDLVDELLEGR